MISVEKQVYEEPQVNGFRSSIVFIVYPLNPGDEQELHVELNSVTPTTSTVRVVDHDGDILFEEIHYFQEHGTLIYTLRNLLEGTYYFEISDDFFHQVKEIRILPAC
jgi:hypothetical protein